jgi:hypothetical protein
LTVSIFMSSRDVAQQSSACGLEKPAEFRTSHFSAALKVERLDFRHV